jgi:hypothetical protein
MMWGTQYIREIKRQFHETYGFEPTEIRHGEPLFDAIPDGDYPMVIEGRRDNVRVVDGKINCGNFDEPEQ